MKPGNSPNFSVENTALPRAFSLIELLVVMAIIGILSGLAVIGFNSINRGSGARGAADLAASLALAARIEAMSMGHGALLVLDNGTNTSRKLQRFALLRYTNTPDPNNPAANAELVGKPTLLPAGTFFLPEYSKDLQTTTLTNLPGSANTPVYYFKFNGSGHLENPEPAYFVFSGNVMDPSGTLENPAAMITGRRGFLLRRNGRPVFFQSPDQMPQNP